jgi:hypothetical protein
MLDPKAPTYKDIFNRRWRTGDVGPKGTDLQRPIPSQVRDMPAGRAIRPHMSAVGWAFLLGDTCRRSGLYGPTAIPSRSDIFKRRWHTQDVGPKGTDLRGPIPSQVRDCLP